MFTGIFSESTLWRHHSRRIDDGANTATAKKRGRPKGAKGDTRVGIERESRNGLQYNDIADMFGVEADYVAKIRREMDANTLPKEQ